MQAIRKPRRSLVPYFIWGAIIAGLGIVAFLPYPYEAGGDFLVLPSTRVEVRARVDGEVVDIEQTPELSPRKNHTIEAVVDRIVIREGIRDRLAEKRILPTAADTGTAVLVMQPFESGALFRQVKGKALPAIAADIDCTSWAQLFLKWIVAHPAVTCVIPATSRRLHLEDNMAAGVGPLPDAATRERIAALSG